MRIQRGGKWIQDENGKDSYVNLGIEENKELLKKYKAYEKDFEQKTKTEGDEIDFTLTGQDFLDQDVTWQQGAPTKLSYQEWAKTQDIKTLRNPRYNDVKFGRKENKQMVGEWLEAKTTFYNRGYKKNAAPWDDIAQDEKDLFSVKIDRYGDHAFQDFFFGGVGFNHATRRLSEDSLAYKLLMSRNTNHDFSSGIGVDDGDNTNNLIPPGSPGSTLESNIKWEGALETLKAQSMVPGSIYRQYAKETLWGELEQRYNKGQTSWRNQNPSAVDKNVAKTTGYNTIDLPWQENVREARNEREVMQQDLVEDILSGRSKVRSGNDIYTRQSDGRYKLTGEIVGQKESDVELDDPVIRTKTELITVGGGRFGNIPTDFVWPGEEKKEKKKRMPQIINIAGKTIAVSSIPEDTYTFIGDKPYTKKEFFIAIQSKRLSKEEISQGGKMATQLQNKRR
jgi:hypothetical protein